jgi:uncharacterized protein (UPF0333 family)
MLGLAGRGQKAQISLEFLIVYSFVLTIFVIMFALISTQRAASLFRHGAAPRRVRDAHIQHIDLEHRRNNT